MNKIKKTIGAFALSAFLLAAAGCKKNNEESVKKLEGIVVKEAFLDGKGMSDSYGSYSSSAHYMVVENKDGKREMYSFYGDAKKMDEKYNVGSKVDLNLNKDHGTPITKGLFEVLTEDEEKVKEKENGGKDIFVKPTMIYRILHPSEWIFPKKHLISKDCHIKYSGDSIDPISYCYKDGSLEDIKVERKLLWNNLELDYGDYIGKIKVRGVKKFGKRRNIKYGIEKVKGTVVKESFYKGQEGLDESEPYESPVYRMLVKDEEGNLNMYSFEEDAWEADKKYNVGSKISLYHKKYGSGENMFDFMVGSLQLNESNIEDKDKEKLEVKK